DCPPYLWPPAAASQTAQWPRPRYVENIVVLRAVGRGLLLLGRAVEVEDVNLVEGFQQTLAHPPVREAVQIDIVGDVADDALAGLLNAPLRPAEKLDEVVVEVDFLFLEAALVIVQQAEDEIIAVLAAKVGVRRIAEDDEH